MDARPARIIQADEWGPTLHRHIHQLTDLFGMGFAQAAAKNGEILRESIHQPPVNGAPASDHAIAQVFLLLQAEIMGAMHDKGIHLTK